LATWLQIFEQAVVMTTDIFNRWDPWWRYRDVPSTRIAAIYDDWEGFRLILTGDKCPATRVSVPHGDLVMYRVYDEIGLVGNNIQGLHPNHSFYTAESSHFLSECSTMHSGTGDRGSLHYAIYTRDRCIDMICTNAPLFVLLREFSSGRCESKRPAPDG
jgi:hypothetical protein